MNTARKSQIKFGLLSIALGVLGWVASFELLTEYIKTLTEPAYSPNCNISILVTCAPNMSSWQGSLLGFSNTIIGVAAFIIPILMGVLMLAGVTLPRWWWRTYLVGLAAAHAFVLWLAWQSIYELNVLCPWCMIVWVATIPLFWLTFAQHSGEGQTTQKHSTWRVALHSYRWVVTFTIFIIIATAAQLRLDWLSEIF